MDLEAKKAVVRRVRRNLEVTEVFCTRILKGNHGSVLVGLTATLDKNATVDEAKVATLLLGAQVDQIAYERALAGSVISERDYKVASRKTRTNYSRLVDGVLSGVEEVAPDPDSIEEVEEEPNELEDKRCLHMRLAGAS